MAFFITSNNLSILVLYLRIFSVTFEERSSGLLTSLSNVSGGNSSTISSSCKNFKYCEKNLSFLSIYKGKFIFPMYSKISLK